MDWAERFFDRVYRDWGAPQRIISDRDSKFTSQFWRCLFKRANVKLALTAAYHPSADGHAERTNQTTEIALRCLLTSRGEHEWETILPDVEFALNTAKSDATGTSPFEVLYGVPPKCDFTGETSEIPTSDDFVKRRERIRKDACDAMAMAQTRMSHYYDRNHTAKEMPSKVYIRMVKGINRGYRLPGNTSLSVIKQGPFNVLRKIGLLAYELDLPPHHYSQPQLK